MSCHSDSHPILPTQNHLWFLQNLHFPKPSGFKWETEKVEYCFLQYLKPKSHQSRTQHGPSRITPEHPGPRDASIRGEPGWKCFAGPSTDDGRSKNIVNPDSTRQHYGWTRTQHGWPRTTTAALRTVPDRSRTMPDPTRCRHGWSRTAPDHPGCATDCPGPPQTQHGPPRTVPY